MKFNLDLYNINNELGNGGYKLYEHQKLGVRWLLKTEKRYNGGLLADEMGLGKDEKIVATIKQTLKEKTAFQKAIDKLAPKIKVSENKTWELKGKGDKMYYSLPAPVDSKRMPIGKEQIVNVFLFDEDGKKIGKNILGMRSEMVTVKDN